ncbi:hypothetical protein LOC68_03000 [Blastopirellula sp. JC732]|uniref:DUF5117 domain-containing protein n=1 Tax=Blastopirellula sediminis TaxID=2894196 RepID=A0A9X1MK24_9BACT|nr:hypothetical protein [Blastopirellula sediminis]MCC9607855.1 hypothetical protein [Blastopirellula sediminis]MCC9627352.1 hypothetical protein [Blastopirellula sediminis]
MRIWIALFGIMAMTLVSASVQAAEAVAISGQPFGVGQITVSFQKADFGDPVDSSGFSIHEADNRIFYPAFEKQRVLGFLQALAGIDAVTPPQRLTVYFLFTGNEPLNITVSTPTPQTFRVTPTPPPHESMLTAMELLWWRKYHEAVRDQKESANYPMVMETYLTAMLSRRLGLPMPPLSKSDMENQDAFSPDQSVFVLMNSDKVRAAEMRSVMMDESITAPADLPTPRPINWTDIIAPRPVNAVPIEPLAKAVPPDCFYVRFGKLSNYLWLNKLIDENGGDLGMMIASRGVKIGLNEVVQKQLALKQSELSELFGDTVVADVALIGRDAYTREGAAIGMLFQAKANDLLANDINTNRKEALRLNKKLGAKLETIKVAGQEISALTTPDNTIRSFYAQRGDFHLVTSSRTIAEQFITLNAETESLGATAEFLQARMLLPLKREDTIFCYMSSQFFQGLYSPQYRVELRRRLRATTEIELLKLARAAAMNEGLVNFTDEELIANGYLPTSFGRRPDGSHVVEFDGQLRDSLRGAPGNFLPIADVPVTSVNLEEARDFERVREFHVSHWSQMDPLMAGIYRFKLDDKGTERLTIDARMTPFVQEKYGMLTERLGPPIKRQIAPAPGDVAMIQFVLKGDFDNQLYHYGVGLQDVPFPIDSYANGGLLNTLRMMQSTPGYLTAWPKPGLIDRIPVIGQMAAPDQYGYSQFPLGLWRREYNGFSTLSFHREILQYVTPQLSLAEDDYPAQARIHIGDISDANVTPLANAMAQSWAKKGSLSNVRYFQQVSNQLGVPIGKAKDFAEDLLALEFVCPLNGKYETVGKGDAERWQSTAWGDEKLEFEANFMKWFRGLNARVSMGDGQVVLNAEIDMWREKAEPTLKLPTFNFFGSGTPAKPKTEKKPEKKGEEIPPPKTQGQEF